MSEQTAAILSAAISAHVSDECDGDLVGGWVLVAETSTVDEMTEGASSFYTVPREHQSNFTTTGLLYRALEIGAFPND
jgi:hypothetical protein